MCCSQALVIMSQLVQDKNFDDRTRAFVHSAVLERLGDDDWGVVDTALSMPCLEALDSELLFQALSSILYRVLKPVLPSTGDTAVATVAEKVL